jgi:uncharacterized integral membrane protein
MSSTEQDPPVQVQRDRKPSGGGLGRLIVPGIVALLILVLIFQNRSEPWRFHFFFWWLSLRAWLMLTALLLIGFLIGMLVSTLLARRRRKARRRAAGS